MPFYLLSRAMTKQMRKAKESIGKLKRSKSLKSKKRQSGDRHC